MPSLRGASVRGGLRSRPGSIKRRLLWALVWFFPITFIGAWAGATAAHGGGGSLAMIIAFVLSPGGLVPVVLLGPVLGDDSPVVITLTFVLQYAYCVGLVYIVERRRLWADAERALSSTRSWRKW